MYGLNFLNMIWFREFSHIFPGFLKLLMVFPVTNGDFPRAFPVLPGAAAGRQLLRWRPGDGELLHLGTTADLTQPGLGCWRNMGIMGYHIGNMGYLSPSRRSRRWELIIWDMNGHIFSAKMVIMCGILWEFMVEPVDFAAKLAYFILAYLGNPRNSGA